MKFARAMQYEGKLQICFHEKEAWNLYELFHTRYNLHKRAYQHRVACVAEMMMVEAMILADRAGFRPLLASDGSGRRLKISEAIHDMGAYTALTDGVLRQLQFSTDDPALAPARELLNRVNRRQFYPLVGECLLEPSKQIAKSTKAHFIRRMKTAIVDQGAKVRPPTPPQQDGRWARRANAAVYDGGINRFLNEDDLEFRLVNINYGMQNQNPVELVGFFRRGVGNGEGDFWSQVNRIEPENVSCLIPKVFSEQYLRMFVKHKSLLPQAVTGWNAWSDGKSLPQTPERSASRAVAVAPAPASTSGPILDLFSAHRPKSTGQKPQKRKLREQGRHTNKRAAAAERADDANGNGHQQLRSPPGLASPKTAAVRTPDGASRRSHSPRRGGKLVTDLPAPAPAAAAAAATDGAADTQSPSDVRAAARADQQRRLQERINALTKSGRK